MAIFYNVVSRKNPLNHDQPPKYYATLKSVGRVGTRELAKQVADETTLNPKEVELSIVLLAKVAKRLLMQGHTLILEDLGTLYLTASSSGAETAEGVSGKSIQSVNVRFTPSRAFKDEVGRAERRRNLR